VAGPGVVPIPPAFARPTVGPSDQLCGDARRFGPSRAQNLEALRLGPAALLAGQHRDNRDALYLELGLGPKDIARLGPARQ
jgi:hypothetical protein